MTLPLSSAGAASEPEFEEVSLGLPAGNCAGLATADLDGDGYAELLAGRREEAKGLHLFSFKGSKWIKLEISSSGEYGGVALANVTGDKRPDAIAAKTSGNQGIEIHETGLSGGELAVSAPAGARPGEYAVILATGERWQSLPVRIRPASDLSGAESAPYDGGAVPPPSNPVKTLAIEQGDLRAIFRDNSDSPGLLSGIDALFNLKDAPGFDAFDPDQPTASAGLNFEHITGGRADRHNMFAPRSGRYALTALPDGRSATLTRLREDDPWAVSSVAKYTVTAPHSIDLEFRCVPRDRSRFAPRGYAMMFWASYMNDVSDVAIHFLGVDAPGGKEKWIAADAPKGHPDWNSGGTYRAADAAPLEYDPDHNAKLNIWSYDYPRFTRPFYYGRAERGMVYILMFRTLRPGEDEIRFSLFKFKVPKKPRPAWDFQYVIRDVQEGREYGYRARAVWKRFVGPEDCLAEYEKWIGEDR